MQTTKIRKSLASYMSTHIKLSKAQNSTIIQSGGSFGSSLDNLGKEALTNIAISLGRDNFPGLLSNLTSKAIHKFESKISGKGAARAGKGFTVFASNENMNDIARILKSLEDSGVLINRISETVKNEKKKRQLSWSLVRTFCGFIRATSSFLLLKRISVRGFRKVG